MTEASHTVHHLKDYQAPDFEVAFLHLDFELEESSTHVKSHMKLKRASGAQPDAPLVLAGEAMKLISIELEGETPDYEVGEHSLTILKVPNEFILSLHVEINPKANTALCGLYISNDVFCTQCESHGFSRITYFLDRPDVLTRFQTTIKADKKRYPLLLSNGNPIEQGEEGDQHWVTWEDPFDKPSYLFALVAGDLDCLEDHFKTMRGREVTLRLFVEKGKLDQADFAMDSLKRAMRWDEQKYGLEYDLDIYMIVAVSDFNMGAMENKGLNVFNDQCILANSQTATDADFERVDTVVAHEYFHNWTGNRVTCRDWFQLSLKEGLTVFREQQYGQDQYSEVVSRIDEVQVLRTHQFSEDAGPMAHSVRPDSYIEINNFYTATVYNKGAEVIRMMHTLLGEAGFRKGMDLYFQRHDGQAVTTDDFVAAMSDANAVDFTQFKLWYSVAGTPHVKATYHYDEASQTCEIQFTQSIPDTPGQTDKPALVIPICFALIDEAGQVSESDDVFVLDDTQKTLQLSNLPSRVVPSLLRGFSAPIILETNYSEADLAHLLQFDNDGFARFEAAQQLWTQTLLACAVQYRAGEAMAISQTVFDAFASVFEATFEDKALMARVIGLPSLAYLSEQVEEIDMEALHQARAHVRQQLSQANFELLKHCYDSCSADPLSLDVSAMAQRSLKNTVLSWIGVNREAQDTVISMAKAQYDASQNMTEALGALQVLNHHDVPERQACLDHFYEKWQHEDLVVNKWFGLQACSDLPDTLARVEALMQHPDFSYHNPNRLRALIGGLSMQNLACFHSRSGAGYALLGDVVIKLDGMNPQIAARLVRPLIQWRRFTAEYKNLMKKQLLRIQGHDKLSPDVYEIVNKSLHG